MPETNLDQVDHCCRMAAELLVESDAQSFPC